MMIDGEQESRLGRAKEGLVAGAGQVAEFTREVVSGTREKAQQVARVVREAETDEELKQRAQDTTERGIGRAGEAVSGAAPAIGRGAEYAADKVGAALKYVARPLGSMVGLIAGTVGGWWKKASELRADLPAAEEEACRLHFAELRLTGLSFDEARSGYALGYIAGCNPEYQGRAFEEVEPDLRHGFGGAGAEYDVLRDFARYGFTRGAVGTAATSGAASPQGALGPMGPGAPQGPGDGPVP